MSQVNEKRKRDIFEGIITPTLVANTFIVTQLENLPVDPTSFEDNIGVDVNDQTKIFKQAVKLMESDEKLKNNFKKLKSQRDSLVNKGTRYITALRTMISSIESQVDQSDAEYASETSQSSDNQDETKPLEGEDLEEIVPESGSDDEDAEGLDEEEENGKPEANDASDSDD